MSLSSKVRYHLYRVSSIHFIEFIKIVLADKSRELLYLIFFCAIQQLLTADQTTTDTALLYEIRLSVSFENDFTVSER